MFWIRTLSCWNHNRVDCAQALHFCAIVGVVNGTQSSLQNLLQSLSYALGLIAWQPQLFMALMAGSVLVVSAALLLYLHFTGALKWLSQRFARQSEYQCMQSGPPEQA